MVDTEALGLVREALAGGKTEQEIITLMKQAGYTDQMISDIMTELKKSKPVDEVAKRIAEKNNIEIKQDLPKLGPQAMPSQQPMAQPTAQAAQPAKREFKKVYKIALILAVAVIAAIIVVWLFLPSVFAF